MSRALSGVIIGGLLMAGLVACGGAEPTVPEPTSRPVKVFLVEGGAGDAVRSFPGKVNASQRAELAFRVSGKVQEVLAKEGDLVQEGQVLARLDPADYELVLEDRQARFDNSQSNFKRAQGAGESRQYLAPGFRSDGSRVPQRDSGTFPGPQGP